MQNVSLIHFNKPLLLLLLLSMGFTLSFRAPVCSRQVEDDCYLPSISVGIRFSYILKKDGTDDTEQLISHIMRNLEIGSC